MLKGKLLVIMATLVATMNHGAVGGQPYFSEYVHTEYSVDSPTDSRSIAMGESFVAVPNNPFSMMYNPAGMAGIKGVSILYDRRNDNRLGIERRYYESVVAGIQTPILDVGVFYTRFNMGDIPITTEQNPNGTGSTVNPYDYTMGLVIAKRVGEANAGITVKGIDVSGYFLGSSSTSADPGKVFAVDLGVLYTHDFPSVNSGLKHRLSIGMSLQNIGQDLKVTSMARDLTFELPQYVRFGGSYHVTSETENPSALMPIRLLLTSEYRNLMNAGTAQNPTRDYWGVGMEATIYDVFAIRLGGYGNLRKTKLRYGFGAQAPLKQLGTGVPITVTLDYSAIPYEIAMPEERSVLHSFSFSVQYEHDLF
jgi:hypothetical protein